MLHKTEHKLNDIHAVGLNVMQPKGHISKVYLAKANDTCHVFGLKQNIVSNRLPHYDGGQTSARMLYLEEGSNVTPKIEDGLLKASQREGRGNF